MRHSSTEEINGFFVIDKPSGLTSHDVVQAVRRHLKTRRVGHLGTLDPLATGVLPLAVGKATRLAQFLSGGLKLYEGTIHLGYSTNTFDGEGQATSKPVTPVISPQQLLEVRNQMLGEQLQVPPPYSAKKVAGVRSYKLARQGIEVSLAPRPIQLRQFDLVPKGNFELDFKIHCSAGTYVRSVAHEVGKRLGCGAHLTRLRRTASNEFLLDQALSLDLFLNLNGPDLSRYLISMNEALRRLPELTVDEETQTHVTHGSDFTANADFQKLESAILFRILSLQGELLALAEPAVGQPVYQKTNSSLTYFHPKVVF
jgi:tRNA pseudouridine55 synthase